MRKTSLNTWSFAAVALFALLFFILAFYSSLQKSITSDETAHIPAGFMILKTGDFRLNLEHPPLVKIFSVLPLLPFKWNHPLTDTDWIRAEEWHYGGYFLYMYNDGNTIALLSRFPIIVLGVILGFLVYFWGSILFVSGKGYASPLAGLLASILYFTEPNLIAHSSLVTYDSSFAFIVFCSGFLYWLNMVRGITFWRLILFVFFMAVAPLIKVVGLFLWFLIFLHLGLSAIFMKRKWRITFPGKNPSFLRTRFHRLLFAISIGLLCCVFSFIFIWASYGFRYEVSPGMKTPPGIQAEKFLNFNLIESGIVRNTFLFIRKHHLIPQGYEAVLGHAFLEKKRFAVLFTKSRPEGGFYTYFFMTTLLKTPFVHLGLFGFILFTMIILWLRYVIRERKRRFSRMRLYLFRAGIPLYLIAGFFAIITLSLVNIGHRLILMIIPLECLLAGAMFSWYLGKLNKRPKQILVCSLLALVLIAPIKAFPHYISYFNPIVRDKRKSFVYLIDSNVDWGQDVKSLGKYLREHNIQKINLSLFGTADPFFYGVKEWNDLGSFVILIPRFSGKEPDLRLYTAVSINMVTYTQRNHPEVLRTGEPKLIGGSILLFPPSKLFIMPLHP